MDYYYYYYSFDKASHCFCHELSHDPHGYANKNKLATLSLVLQVDTVADVDRRDPC